MIKNSRQRNYIKQLLMDRTDHPTAAVIYEDVKKEYPNISLGTVYRNLSLLVELGEIRKVNGGGESDHYDGNMKPHCHHVCINCGSVHDVYLGEYFELQYSAQRQTPHRIISGEITFTGICSSCDESRSAAEQGNTL